MADLQPPQAQARPGDSINQLTACRRCRKQKLRCSREKPACKRCIDISAFCTYPPPPDRKLLAAQRAQNAKARALSAMQSGSGSTAQGQGQGQSHDERPSLADNAAISSDRSSSAGQVQTRDFEPIPQQNLGRENLPMPSPQVALELIELYFSRLYHANLIFHKQTFISSYISGDLPDFVAMSVFCLAAIFIPAQSRFYDEGRSHQQFGPGSVTSLSECYHHHGQWARTASQMALMNADQPRLEVVQACQNVALYWFAVGQINRTDMHSHVALRTCRLLGYQNLLANEHDSNSLENETRRRVFWSCWTTNCISQDNADFKSDAWEEAFGLPFPSDDESFARCNPVLKEKFGKDGAIVPIDPNETSPRRAILAEMMKYFGLWWEIQKFVKDYAKDEPNDSSVRIAKMLSLDRRLDYVYENMHPDFRYNGSITFSDPKIDPYRIFSMHCVYHLCACTLHSSIVPVFSSSPSDSRISKKLVRMSAEESVKQSLRLADMATAFVAAGLDKSRLSGLNGYAMFVCSNLQFKSLGSQGKLRSHGLMHLQAAIAILEVLKGYWKPLTGTWSNLESLFAYAQIDITNLSGQNQRNQQLDGARDYNPNIDQIASHREMPACPSSNADLYTYISNSVPSNAEPNAGSKRSQSNTPISQALSPGSTTGGTAMGPVSPNRSTLPIHTSSAMQQSLPRAIMVPSHDTQSYGHSKQPQTQQQQPTQQPAQQQQHQQHQQHLLSSQSYEAQYNPQVQHQGGVSGTQNYTSVVAVAGQNMPMGYQVQVPMPMEGLIGDGATDGTNLWWDHSFESIGSDPFGFLLGGMPGGEGGGFYTPNGRDF